MEIMTSLSFQEIEELIAASVRKGLESFSKQTPDLLSDRISLDEACEITGLLKPTIYKCTMGKNIPFQKFGKRLVFSRKELLEWMKSRTISPDSIIETIDMNLQKSAKKHLKKC